MYIGINKFSASASGHKLLHVFTIQQEVAYYMHPTSYHMDTCKSDVYVCVTISF